MMNKAISLIRTEPHYRAEAFTAGLQACGYTVTHHWDNQVGKGDVVAIWNKYGSGEHIANEATRKGAQVIVAENGYLGADDQKRQFYALALDGHNGSGRWTVGSHKRWNGTLAPWREDGRHILVCGQRGIGSKLMASPHAWHENVVRRLQMYTKRPIVVRLHPGTLRNHNQPVTLEQQIENAWAVVIWSSSSGVKALAAGVPVFYDAPHFICEGAACRDLSKIENPPMPDRVPAFESMAWAQWSVDEIAAGLPFKALLA